LVWYPGEEGGNAVADVLFGKVSPSGRLPITFPKSLEQLPPYEDYSMKGRTYRYMSAEPMYPFGFGLSYSKFEYSNLKLSKPSILKSEPVKVTVTVKNKGKYAADEVVQLYLTHEGQTNGPLFSMKGFKRVSLQPGATALVSFDLTPELLSSVQDNGQSVVMPGTIKIAVGGSLPIGRSEALGASKHVEAVLRVNE